MSVKKMDCPCRGASLKLEDGKTTNMYRTGRTANDYVK